MSEPLPNGWAHPHLDHVALVVAGNPAPQGAEHFKNGRFNLVRVYDMGMNGKNTFLTKTRDLINDVAAEKMRLIPANSILFTKSGASTLLNQRAILAKDSYVVSHIAAAIPSEGVESKWLFYFLQLVDFATLAHATNMPSLPLSRAKAIRVPIAPRTEQARIVAKIEELFSELDSGVESLKAARAKLKVYRQAVLKQAFEGKLTAQWREENKDKLESPEQMLARIKQERESRYEKQLQQWKAAVKKWEEGGKSGRKPVKPKKPKNPLPIAVRPMDTPFWTHLSLSELAGEAVLGKMLDKKKNTGTPRFYLGNINLRWGRFDLENLKTMKVEESEIERYCLTKGDLVICEGGEPGRCAVWEGQESTMLIQKALHRVRFTESYNPYFAYYFMTYAASSGLLSSNFTGSTIKHLTGKGLGNVLFPICTLMEQNQIVNLLDRAFNVCEELDRQIEPEIRRSNSLRQSVLSEAFSGQLVQQDPNDEPASILLERIKAEKTAQSKINTQAKRRRTAATT